MPELTLAIKRPNGLLLVDGCSHAGIETILEAASAIDPRTEIVFGGLHLVTTPVEEIDTLVGNLQTKWKVQRIAPGHCTFHFVCKFPTRDRKSTRLNSSHT